MRLYDPTSSRPGRSLFRAAALSRLEGKTIGILENGKLNAVEMLREIAALFEARHGCVVRQIYSKSNASAPAPARLLAQVVGEVDFLITGLGD
jgi:hypothetical protein